MGNECDVEGSPRHETGTNKKIELICVVRDFVGGCVRHLGGVGTRRSPGDGEPREHGGGDGDGDEQKVSPT